jgi:hypothetical protein
VVKIYLIVKNACDVLCQWSKTLTVFFHLEICSHTTCGSDNQNMMSHQDLTHKTVRGMDSGNKFAFSHEPRGQMNAETINIRREEQMMYVDSRYVSVARKSELLQHERTMNQLRRQVAQLSKAVAWELEQHQTRLKELQLVEDTLEREGQHTLSPTRQPTLEPVPSQKWTKFRKHTHRAHQKPAAELVG